MEQYTVRLGKEALDSQIFEMISCFREGEGEGTPEF